MFFKQKYVLKPRTLTSKIAERLTRLVSVKGVLSHKNIGTLNVHELF